MYSSITNAAEHLGVAMLTVRRHPADENNNDYVRLDSSIAVTYRILVITYPSPVVVSHHVGINTTTLNQRVKDPNYPDYVRLTHADDATPTVPPRDATPAVTLRTPPRFAVRPRIDGRVYPSLRAAAKGTGVGIQAIRRRLVSEKYPNYVVERQDTPTTHHTCRYTVVVDGKTYGSTRMVVNAGLTPTTQEVRRRADDESARWADWKLVEVFEVRSNDYPDAE